MNNHNRKPTWIPGMCRRGNECMADLHHKGVSLKEAIEECCRRGGHRPGDGHSPPRPRRR